MSAKFYLTIAAIFVAGCAAVTYAQQARVIAELKQVSKANVWTACHDGIVYFAVYNNNPFMSPFLTGAVIDPATDKPKRC